jgi:nicotinamide mononucleotide adenylyltransferase
MSTLDAGVTGLIGMSAKPFHAGHAAAIELAASECERVAVYVSLADRRRPGEFTVLGRDMATIWRELIEPNLGPSITVEYVTTPVGAIWQRLGQASEVRRDERFVIYGTEDDLLERFRREALIKYAPNLVSRDAVHTRSTQRLGSGTAARAALARGDFVGFSRMMPTWLNPRRAWAVLTGQ